MELRRKIWLSRLFVQRKRKDIFYYNSLEKINIYISKVFLQRMEKDVGKIAKNPDTDIIVRIDDFGGRVGLTIREFVKGERYTGFTKAGTRIPADQIVAFKEMINSIDEKELESAVQETSEKAGESSGEKENVEGSVESPGQSSGETSSGIEEKEM
mgnify:CR=1 FL=1